MIPEVLKHSAYYVELPSYAGYVIANTLTLSAGTWLLVSNISFDTEANATYDHFLEYNNELAAIVRGNMANGGGTCAQCILETTQPATVKVQLRQYSDKHVCTHINNFTAIKIGK